MNEDNGVTWRLYNLRRTALIRTCLAIVIVLHMRTDEELGKTAAIAVECDILWEQELRSLGLS